MPLHIFGILLLLISCKPRTIVAEFEIKSEKCTEGKLILYSDSTYSKTCLEDDQTGNWTFKSVHDSLLSIERVPTTSEQLNKTTLYFIQNNQLFPLENQEQTVKFNWNLSKDLPAWTVYEDRLMNNSVEHIQLISLLDSSLMSLVTKEETGHLTVTLKGYYFSYPQEGESSGGSIFRAKTFLVIGREN